MKIALFVIAVVIVLVILGIKYYNQFVKGKLGVEKSSSNIDVVRKKRFDLIPNLLECVKKYISYEQETLQKIVQARSTYEKAQTSHEKNMLDGILNDQLSKLFALAENYPDLKADTQFTNLQNELSTVEGELVVSRNQYNEAVRAYNEDVKVFPNNIFASVLGFREMQFIEIEDKEKENIKVDFSK